MKKFLLFLLTILITINLGKPAFTQDFEQQLPPLQTYQLPPFLATWQNDNNDNYFTEIKPHLVGYLLWLNFPIKVYVESPPNNLPESSYQKFLEWQKIAEKAITIWESYLPLNIIKTEENADILIYRRQPKIEAKLNPETGLYDIPRAKAATTSIKFYLTEILPIKQYNNLDHPLFQGGQEGDQKENYLEESKTSQPQKKLQHRMIIEVNPNQNNDYLLANITHELGHALGIWGHSPAKTDIMYYSHTSDIPQISVRDINTLKLIYQQSTRLGGQLKM